MLQAIAPTAIFRNGVLLKGGMPFGINPDEVEGFKLLGYKIIGEKPKKEEPKEKEIPKMNGSTKKTKQKTAANTGV